MSFTVAFPRHQFVLIQFTSLLYSIWNLLPRRVYVRLTFAYKRNYPNPSRSYTLTHRVQRKLGKEQDKDHNVKQLRTALNIVN